MEVGVMLESPNALYTVAFFAFLLASLCTNVLLLLLFIRNPVLLSPTNLLLVHLGVCNISLVLLSLSFSLVTTITSQWIFPPLIATISGISTTFLGLVTPFTAFTLTSERFFLLSNHRRYRDVYTTRSVVFRIVACWVVSGTMAAVPVIPGLGGYVFDPRTAVCPAGNTTTQLLPTVVNAVYLVLWVYTVQNIVTIPSAASVPEPLRQKHQTRTSPRGGAARYLGVLLVSGVYSLHAAVDVVLTSLERLGVLESLVATGRAKVMTWYMVVVVMPLLAILFDPQLRAACTELCKRGVRGGERSDGYEYESVFPSAAQSCMQQTSFTKVPVHDYPFVQQQQVPYTVRHVSATLPPGMVGFSRPPPNRQIATMKTGTLPIRPSATRPTQPQQPRMVVRSQSLNHGTPTTIPVTVVRGRCDGGSSSSAGSNRTVIVKNGKFSSTTSSSTVGEIVDL
eukprot:sb/3464600/